MTTSLRPFGTFPRGFAEQTQFAWDLVPAGKLVELKYGKSLVEKQRAPGNIPVYGTNGPCGSHDASLAEGPGVILGRKGMGPLGVEWSETDFWVIDTAYYVSPKVRDLDLKFFYFLVKYIGLNHLKDGTSNPSLSRDTFSAQLFPHPPLSEQRAIAHILGTLDDKIENNRKMNETLEGMARAIFKSWFVDFDPVRAKMEGRAPVGMDAETAALFPDSFEDSPLGKIPKGWKVDRIYSLANVIYGAPFSSKRFNETGFGLPLIRIRDLATHDPKVFTHEEHPKGTRVKPGDIVVGMDGEFRVHLWKGPTSWLNQRVCKFAPIGGTPRAFIQFSIQEPLDFFERSKVGTTVIHLGKTDIDTFSVICPTPSILGRFGEITEPILDKLVANQLESRSLAATRDALLPKLLSGEIRVKD